MSIATMGAMAGRRGYRFVVVSFGIKLRNDEVFEYLAPSQISPFYLFKE